MADVLTPNMSLTVPGVGTSPGPDWASLLNADLNLIDAHNHSPGYGVPIGVDGLNIQNDLPLNSNNLTLVRSVRFDAQDAPINEPTDLGCLYESGVDLYYNDGNGNQVRITQSGGVAGTPGSIANLTSPASATYVGGTPAFVWESDANVPANMDAGSYIFRNLTVNSFGLTLSPPNAMASNYALTLPQLPSSQKIMTLDNTGLMSAPWSVDTASLSTSGSVLQVKDGGISTDKIADGAVTPAKRASWGQQIASSSGSFNAAGGSFSDITNQSVTVTTTGKPVLIFFQSATTSGGDNGCIRAPSADQVEFRLMRDSTPVFTTVWITRPSAAGESIPPGVIQYLDVPSAGSYTYKLQAKSAAATIIDECQLVVIPM